MNTPVTIDLETMPTQSVEQKRILVKNIKPPSNYKKQDIIDAWIKDKEYKIVSETSFNGGLGGIYCIGLAIQDEAPFCIETEDYKSFESERVVLEKLNEKMAGVNPWFIGHNLSRFDLLFLRHRYIIHRLLPTFINPWSSKPWDNAYFDTACAWIGNGQHDYLKLDDLCNYLNVPTPKGSIDGSQVWNTIKNGKGSEVAKYCQRDIVATRSCYHILKQFM